MKNHCYSAPGSCRKPTPSQDFVSAHPSAENRRRDIRSSDGRSGSRPRFCKCKIGQHRHACKRPGHVLPHSGRNWDHNPAPLTSPRSIFLLTEQLAQIWTSNERDLAELRGLRPKVAQARAYLASPGCNRSLGLSYLERLETTRRIHLARLRANRRSAWQLLSQLDHISLRSCCHASRDSQQLHPFSDQRRQLTPYGSGEPSHGPIRDRGR